MRIVPIHDIDPRIKIFNHHHVAKGQTWANRRLSDVQFILILEGQFEYLSKNEELTLSPYQILCIEPDIPHTFRISNQSEMGILSGFHCEMVPEGNWLTKDYRLEKSPSRVITINSDHAIVDLFKAGAKIYQSYSLTRNASLSDITRTIVMNMSAYWETSFAPQNNARMDEMIAMVRENLVAGIDRNVLSKAFHMTPEHINHLFRRELGMTPGEVLNRERCLKASTLITQENFSVKRAALEVGYKDPFYFSRVFKKVMGFLPSVLSTGRSGK